MRVAATSSLAAWSVPPDFPRCTSAMIYAMIYAILSYFSMANKSPSSQKHFPFASASASPFLNGTPSHNSKTNVNHGVLLGNV